MRWAQERVGLGSISAKGVPSNQGLERVRREQLKLWKWDGEENYCSVKKESPYWKAAGQELTSDRCRKNPKLERLKEAN